MEPNRDFWSYALSLMILANTVNKDNVGERFPVLVDAVRFTQKRCPEFAPRSSADEVARRLIDQLDGGDVT